METDTVNLPIGTIRTPNGLYSGLWALPRPKTHHWGSGALLERVEEVWGPISVAFGKQDQVSGMTIDKDMKVKPMIVADWEALPFLDCCFESAYWDPPYLGFIGEDGDVHYNRLEKSLAEICRVVRYRLLILSPLVYPCPDGYRREAVIGITYGANKVIRCLQSYIRSRFHLTPAASDPRYRALQPKPLREAEASFQMEMVLQTHPAGELFR